jgi:hypothetical protein
MDLWAITIQIVDETSVGGGFMSCTRACRNEHDSDFEGHSSTEIIISAGTRVVMAKCFPRELLKCATENRWNFAFLRTRPCNDIQKKVLNAAQLVELGMGVKAKFPMRGEVSIPPYQLQAVSLAFSTPKASPEVEGVHYAYIFVVA